MSIVLFKYFIHFLYIMLFDDNVSADEFLDYKPDPDLTELIASKNPLLRNLQKKTPVIIEIAGVTC